MQKLMHRVVAIAVLMILMSIPLLSRAQDTPPVSQPAPHSHRMPAMHKLPYVCEGDAKVVVFLREKTARVTFEGNSYLMKQTITTDGTRYSDGAHVWWSKGETGFLEDDTNTDKPVKLADHCKLARPENAKTDPVVIGTVAYRERMAMPENAVLTIQLQDISLEDAPAKIIAEQTFRFAGHQVPLPFELHYDASKINPSHKYALSAKITVDGQLMFVNSTTYLVITHKNPDKVDMLVQMVEGQTKNQTKDLTK